MEISADIQKKISEARPSEPPKEGALTKTIEEYTAKLPSISWLGMAGGSMVLSAVIAATTKRKGAANFVGLWVPSLLLLGIYNKLVKMEKNVSFDRGSLH